MMDRSVIDYDQVVKLQIQTILTQTYSKSVHRQSKITQPPLNG